MNFDKLLEKINSNKFESEHLNLSKAVLDHDKIERLVDALSNNTQVTSLDISDTAIDDEDLKKILTINHLKSLDVSDNIFEETGFAALANSQIKRLNLSNTDITNDSLKLFANNQHLQELTLNGNTLLTQDGLAVLKSTKIRTLRICNFFCDGNEIVNALADENAPFVELILMQNGITDQGIKVLSNNKQLKKLDLIFNQITFSGAQQLISNLTLKELNLNNNQLNLKELDQVREMVSNKYRLSKNSAGMFHSKYTSEHQANAILKNLTALDANNPMILAQIILNVQNLFPNAYNLATELSKSQAQGKGLNIEDEKIDISKTGLVN